MNVEAFNDAVKFYLPRVEGGIRADSIYKRDLEGRVIILQDYSCNMAEDKFKVDILNDSIKFYLPRVEGYLEVVRDMSLKYKGMSLIEFDGYFEGKFEPTKYMRVEIHTNNIDEERMMKEANRIRLALNQKSLAFEFNNKLILVSES